MTFQVALLYIDSVFVFSANFPSTFTLKMTFLELLTVTSSF